MGRNLFIVIEDLNLKYKKIKNLGQHFMLLNSTLIVFYIYNECVMKINEFRLKLLDSIKENIRIDYVKLTAKTLLEVIFF